jgi:hypothetical protein
MSAIISKKDKEELYTKVKHQLGYPINVFELKDEMLDSYFKIALEDYSSYINNWLIEQQWSTLQGIGTTPEELTFALTTKSNDFEKSFTFAYSKQVGLGAGGKGDGWELKKDYITVVKDQQVYVIPKDREVNEVLWLTPAMLDQGIIDPFATTNWGSSSFGWQFMGRPAQYMQPTYSILLSAQDRSFKRRLVQSDLTYRITGGPNGTKLLYLYPLPGSRNEISGRAGKHMEGSKVWYFYYDTSKESRKKCLKQNEDVIKLPSDVKLDNLTWDKLNSVAQTRVRKLFQAEVMMGIGKIRGFFSGNINLPDVSVTMDYRMVLDRGEKLREEVMKETTDSLDKMSYKQLMEDRASIADNLNKTLQYQAMPFPIIKF